MHLDCLPCFARQIVHVCDRLAPSPEEAVAWAREALAVLSAADWNDAPPVLAAKVQAKVRQLAGVADPFLEAKRRHNAFFLARRDAYREHVRRSADPLGAAVHLAIAGNVADLGVNPSLQDHHVDEAVAHALAAKLDERTLASFRRDIAAARRILYLGDNAGEIVLDRLLVEQLPAGKVTFVVRGAPVLNDALLEDARAAGLHEVAEVITNGSDIPGTVPEHCSPEFRARLAKADLIISKGQGNFETLPENGRLCYFLLKVKCGPVAERMGLPEGELVFQRRAARR